MSDETDQLGCTGSECEWQTGGSGSQPGCEPGATTCPSAKLLTAMPSVFHDQALIDLTQQINALLQAVPPDPAGRKLSFMYTRMGPLLGWVEHGQEGGGTAGAVTAASDNTTVMQALGLLL